LLSTTSYYAELVNEELERRNEELTILNSDLVNLLASINIPVIMLDRNLKIRRYTPHTEKIWNLIASDIGRPVSDINQKIKIPELKEKIARVIETLETEEIETRDHAGNWYSVKIRPYKSIDNKIDGVVVSMLKSSMIQDGIDFIFKSFSETLFNTVNEPLVVLKKDQTIIRASKSFLEKFGSTELTGRKLTDIAEGKWNIPEVKRLLSSLYSGKKTILDSMIKLGQDELLLNAGLIRLHDEQDELVLLAVRELLK